MDPYLRPILISSTIVLIFNTLLILPVISAPIVTYFLGGALAVFLYWKELKEKFTERMPEIQFFDIAALGLGVGLVAGGILAFIFALKMQNPELESQLVGQINESIKLKGLPDTQMINELTPAFAYGVGIFIIILGTILSFLGGITAWTFVNRAKK